MITAFLFWGRAHARRELDWQKFFISRLFRIYPLYLLVFSAVLLAVMYKSDWTDSRAYPEDLVKERSRNGSSFRARTLGYFKTWIIVAGVTWTLVGRSVVLSFSSLS